MRQKVAPTASPRKRPYTIKRCGYGRWEIQVAGETIAVIVGIGDPNGFPPSYGIAGATMPGSADLWEFATVVKAAKRAYHFWQAGRSGAQGHE